MLVATTNDLAGYRITAHLGMVRGVTVRSRSVIGNVGGAIQSIFEAICRSTPSSPSTLGRKPTN